MNFSDFSGLDDECAPAPKPLSNQMMVNGSGSKKCSDRNPADSDSPVREDEKVVKLWGLFGLLAEVVDDGSEVSGFADRVGDVDHLGRPAAVVGEFDDLQKSLSVSTFFNF